MYDAMVINQKLLKSTIQMVNQQRLALNLLLQLLIPLSLSLQKLS